MDRRQFLLFLSATAGWAGCKQATTDTNQQHSTFVTLESEEYETPFLQDVSGRTLLRYRFKKGEELRWNVQHTLKMKNIIGGLEENIETRSRSVKIWKTLDVDEKGTAVFEYRVEDIDMHRAQSGHDDAVFDSRRDKTIPPGFDNLEGKIGVPLARIKIDSQGETTKKPMQEYEGSVSENRIVIPLPNEPVGIGSTWSETKQIDLPQANRMVKKIRIRHDFTLEKIHSGLATIKFATIPLIQMTPQEESKLLDKFSVGTMELDLQAGHFIQHEATIDRQVVGVQGAGCSVRYLSRTTECCCGRRACKICSVGYT